jgi:glutaredoxin
MITLYTKPDCAFCTKAKQLLGSLGLSYEEKVLGRDFTRGDLLESFPNAKTYPIVVVNGEFRDGYERLEREIIEQRQNYGKTFLTEGSF